MRHHPVVHGREAGVFHHFGHTHAQGLDRLVGHAQDVGVHHHLAPHLHVGGQAFVERAEILEPAAQRLALRVQFDRLSAAARHHAAHDEQHDGGGRGGHHRHERVHGERRHDACDQGERPQRHHGALIALALGLEEIVFVRLGGQKPLPLVEQLDEALGMFRSVAADGAEPQGIGAVRHRVEHDFDRLAVERAFGRLLLPAGQPRDVVIVDLLRRTALCLLVAARIDAHRPDARQMHQRGQKIAFVLGIPSPQAADRRRMHAGVGNVAPVLLDELRLVFLAVAEEHDQARHHERKRADALGIGLRGKACFVLDGRFHPVARMDRRRRSRKRRKPRTREQRMHLGVAARIHRGNRQGDGARIVE